MDEEKRFRECPFCGGKAFTVDWSAMDRRSEPYTLRERYACNDCGKRMIQSYAYGGWKGNQGSGEGYLAFRESGRGSSLQQLRREIPVCLEARLMGARGGEE